MAPSWCRRSLALCLSAALFACGAPPQASPVVPVVVADVVGVEARGMPMAYAFAVGVASADTGCEQYADWWEVVSENGKLLYRRVLLHSHVDEQPFTRSGGPVPIQAATRVWVRAHMNTVGYGGGAWYGSVQTGFEPAVPPAGFAAQLATQGPLPSGCDF